MLLTAFILLRTDLLNAWFLAVIVAPLALAFVSSQGKLSYTVNVRIIFPISVGLFFVALYHYFPTLIETMSGGSVNAIQSEIQNASRFGIVSGLAQSNQINGSFFQVNDLFKDAVTVLYAICVAFLLLKGLNDFDELKGVLYAEANLVRTTSDFATYFISSGDPTKNEPIVETLRGLLHDYLDNILVGQTIDISEKN
ncbi:MAG: hypothetical protein AAF678_03120, partial [Pseudomonadota bacterium]